MADVFVPLVAGVALLMVQYTDPADHGVLTNSPTMQEATSPAACETLRRAYQHCVATYYCSR